MSEKPTEEKEYTPEELAEMKANMKKFYTEEIEFLEVQLKFETLKASIEEQRAKGIMYNMKIAQLLTPPDNQEESKRKLKQETHG